MSAAEQSIAQSAGLAGGIASAGGAFWALANDAAAAIFGVPIGVVLAAAAGAFFARTFTAPSSFWQTLRAGIGWTLCGAYSLPLAMHLSGWPPSMAASAAFVLSAGLQLLAPALVPVILRNSPAWFQAWGNRLFGASSREGGSQ